MKNLLLLPLLALGLSAEAQQTCFGSSCSSSGSSTITPSTPTSGFTANTLIRTDGTNFLSGPKYASTGDLSLLFGVNRCMDSGGSDAYSCALSGGSLTAYGTGGLQITLRATTANTGTATLDVDGLGAKTITRADGSTLVTGDITANGFLGLVYDGTNFRMLSQWMRGSTGSGDYVLATSPTFTGNWTAGTAGSIAVAGGHLLIQPTYGLFFGAAGTSPFIGVRTGVTPNAPAFFTYSTSNSWYFAESADNGYDFQNPCLTGLGTAACTDPTFILHSSVRATNQAMSLGHNQTQGVITANGGVLARSLTYASGSDVGLTVQGSLTGNIQEWKTSAGSTLNFIDSSGRIVLPNAGFRFGSTVGATGMLWASGLQIFVTGANYPFFAHATGITTGAGQAFSWTSATDDATATKDTFLYRHSAGVIRAGGSATAIAGLLGGGAAVASATALPLPTGRVFHVTGTTTITSITSTNFASGAVITLIFDGVLTFTDGSNLKLAGDFVTTADDTITLVYDGTSWFETARSIN